ncbi:MAG: acyl-CoA dehydrogenase family protein [bacterium]
MDAFFSAEQDELRASVRRFLADRAPLAWVRGRWADERGTSDEIWRAMTDLGLVGLLIPEDLGGVGAGMQEAGVVLEELGRMAHPGPFLASSVGAASALLALDARAHARALAAGERIATLALVDAGRGFARWREPIADEAEGRLTGRKVHVLDGMAADLFLVTAGSHVWAVRRDAPGVRVASEPTVDGTRRFATLTLEDTPAELLGPIDALELAVDRVAIGLAVDGLGAAQAALALAVDHAKTRVQFGRPIGAFQSIAHLAAEMLQTVETGRAGAYYALWAADQADALECHRAAALTKAYASANYVRVASDAIQIFGGSGFTWEVDLHLFYKRLMSLEQDWGGDDFWLDELARMVVDGEARNE